MQLDVILVGALVLNWRDLMPDFTSGLINVEYHVNPLGSVEFVTVWASTVRGYWSLICGHWARLGDSRGSGPSLGNGYESAGLSKMLGNVLQQQELFLRTASGTDRTIQIRPPSDAGAAAAMGIMDAFCEQIAN